MVSTLPAEALDVLANRFGDAFSALGPDEVQTLVTAAVEGDVTNQRLQETVARHRVDITRMLRGLVQQGFLVAHGSGRGTRYRVSGVSLPDVTPGIWLSWEALDSQGSAANSQGSAASSQGSAASSQGSAANSQGSAASSQGSTRADQLDARAIPVLTGAADEPGLQVLAGDIGGRKRAPAARVREVILLLCAQRFLSLQDLAVLLRRHAEHLRNVYLRPMVAEGLLVLRFPAQPNHPAAAVSRGRQATRRRDRIAAMTVHVVLFRPRPDVGDAEREHLFEAMRAAAREIPSVRGFRIGQHIEQPVPYVMTGFPPFPWVALLEFEDEAGLRAYLSHPLHMALGQRFNAAAEAAMIYDYTIADDLR